MNREGEACLSTSSRDDFERSKPSSGDRAPSESSSAPMRVHAAYMRNLINVEHR